MNRWLLAGLAGGAAVVASTGLAPDAAAAEIGPRLVAIGIPGEDLGTQPDAGAVEVRAHGKQPAILFPSDYKQGDRFGTATKFAEVTGDSMTDLLVGAPGRDVDGKVDAGAIYVYKGTSNGFTFLRTLVQGKDGVPGSAQTSANFGSTFDVTAGDGTSQVTVGLPRWNVGAATDAGAVVMLDLDLDATPKVTGQLLTQGTDGIPGTSQKGDRWGTAVIGGIGSGFMAVGAPGETVSGAAGAGAIMIYEDFGYRVITQNTAGIGSAAEAGDGFGSALVDSGSELWIGVPGEDIGSLADAGMANTMISEMGDPHYPGPNYNQDSANVDGTAEAGDRFGSAFAHLRPDEDTDYDFVYVGVPGEDVGSARDAGMVNIMWAHESRTQNSTAGVAEPGDRFGSAITAETVFGNGLVYHVLYGSRGEDGGAGAVVVTGTGKAIWKQVTGAPEAGDGYGSAIDHRL